MFYILLYVGGRLEQQGDLQGPLPDGDEPAQVLLRYAGPGHSGRTCVYAAHAPLPSRRIRVPTSSSRGPGSGADPGPWPRTAGYRVYGGKGVKGVEEDFR